jgi:hypothetical protein
MDFIISYVLYSSGIMLESVTGPRSGSVSLTSGSLSRSTFYPIFLADFQETVSGDFNPWILSSRNFL